VRLITFGYGNDKSPNDRLFPELRSRGCKVLFDVRDRPESYKRPDWSFFGTLPGACLGARIIYRHLPCLGNPPQTVLGSSKKQRSLPWKRPKQWRYGIRLIAGTLALHGCAAIMCCEQSPFKEVPYSPYVYDNCHRVEIAHLTAEYFADLFGIELQIIHLTPPKKETISYFGIPDERRLRELCAGSG